jgi:hypothetical protein
MNADLVDNSPWATSKWCHLINIKKQDGREESVVNFTFKAYGSGSPKVKNADNFELNVVEASVTSLEFIYIHSATMRLVNYFLGFLDLQELAMKLAAWPLPPIGMCKPTLHCFFSYLLVLLLRMKVDNPYILVPESPTSTSCLIADLGKTSVGNLLYLQAEEGAPLVSTIEVTVESLQLSSIQTEQRLEIFNMPKLPLRITVPLPLPSEDGVAPFPTAVGKVSIPSIEIALQVAQVPFLLSLVKEQFLPELPVPDQGKHSNLMHLSVLRFSSAFL